jgi:hypothetical protein
MNHVVYSQEEVNCFFVVDKKGKRVRTRSIKRNRRSKPYWPDSIKEGVLTPLADGTLPTPGSGRVADLAAFYDVNTANEISPFSFENLD